MEQIERYLSILKADLGVEIDLHGGRTEMARNLRHLIVEAEKEIEELKTGEERKVLTLCRHCAECEGTTWQRLGLKS